MISGQNREMRVAEPMATTPRPRKPAVGRYRLVSWLCAPKAVSEAVTTRVRFNASPKAIWNHIMFYEELPGRPPFLLRALLPHPVRTEGDKTRVGATVRCEYRGGDLVKRITAVKPHHSLQFEVIEQSLGIEDCVMAVNGSYEINRSGDGSEVVLTTNYRAYLRPSWAWRPLEKLLVSQLHRHILDGILASVASIAVADPVMRPVAADSLAESLASGGLTCTTLRLRSRP
jgi:Polyketide cyclase / dehydrase and lipid transport